VAAVASLAILLGSREDAIEEGERQVIGIFCLVMILHRLSRKTKHDCVREEIMKEVHPTVPLEEVSEVFGFHDLNLPGREFDCRCIL